MELEIIERKNCVICTNDLENIFSIGGVPIKLTCLPPEERHQEENNTVSTLSFSKCSVCNTIQLDRLIPLEILYSGSHNLVSVGQTWENYFKRFVNFLSPLVEDKTVIEIGCPSGKIESGLKNYKSYTIVDPNVAEEISSDGKKIFVKKFFEDYVPAEKFDVIVHSHFFEHVYNHKDFLGWCNEILADDGVMVFGIPNMEHIAERGLSPFVGVFFEHTVFLNVENVSSVLLLNGFETQDVIHYENHSIIFKCKKCKQKNAEGVKDFKIADMRPLFFKSISGCFSLIQEINEKIKGRKNVYIFGASYNTQLLFAFGLDRTNIKGILDNCEEKQGKYLYGVKLLVYSPLVLKEEEFPIVIIKNGVYCEEIKFQIKNIRKETIII
jgi:2-polyprenyl-3-methyl-5-hydroxy-6-metoxy-1,4-benzoquinol methylase